jgi:DNA-binding response OmpR family regulator
MDATAVDVLLVEDDPPLREVLAAHLRARGWRVVGCDDGLRALELCRELRPDVVVLDVMLPGCSGLDVCARLRSAPGSSPGVVMLTARDAELDVIMGLDVGADDYVTKPCRPREVVARVHALMRRLGRATSATPTAASADVIDRGPLRVEVGARRVTVLGRPVKLIPTEFALLALLAKEPERVFTRMTLLASIWSSTHEAYARNVDCHVTRLRRKLEAAGLATAPIQTCYGAGYAFGPVAPVAAAAMAAERLPT